MNGTIDYGIIFRKGNNTELEVLWMLVGLNQLTINMKKLIYSLVFAK